MPLPFWRAMAGCIAIGSLATTVDWFVSFTLHKPIKCSYKCVIEKGFSEEEKRDFPILTSISRRSNRSHISGSRGYDSNRVRILIYRWFLLSICSAFLYLFVLWAFAARLCVLSSCFLHLHVFFSICNAVSSFACVFFSICMCVFFYLQCVSLFGCVM